MKKLTKILFVAGGSLLLTGGAVANYLFAQVTVQPSELTLANIEVLAAIGDRQEGAPYGVRCGAIQVINGKKYECSATVITCQGVGGMCQSRSCPTHEM